MCFLLIELLKIASLYNRREKSSKKDSIEILAKNLKPVWVPHASILMFVPWIQVYLLPLNTSQDHLHFELMSKETWNQCGDHVRGIVDLTSKRVILRIVYLPDIIKLKTMKICTRSSYLFFTAHEKLQFLYELHF